jgi:hypothetical protein
MTNQLNVAPHARHRLELIPTDATSLIVHVWLEDFVERESFEVREVLVALMTVVMVRVLLVPFHGGHCVERLVTIVVSALHLPEGL